METKIITCTGYGGSGSSAITDLLKEFNNGISLGDAEFWFLQAYNGVSDLEYFLVDGNHRSKVNLAVKRFLKYVDDNEGFYSNFFGKNYKEYSYEYIESLISAKFRKSISQYEIESSLIRKIIFQVSPLIQRVFKRTINGEFTPYIPRVEKYYSYPGKEKFYIETKKYTSKLFNEISNTQNKAFIAIDQLVPSTNTLRYFNYIDNLKVIIVDRDPRDLYLLNETVWQGAAFVCDTSDTNSFIDWYRTMRIHRNHEIKSQNVLYMMLEDMIYNYEKTIREIYRFLDLDSLNHIHKKKYFNPEISINNTKLWMKKENEKYLSEISKIEKELSEYCYK